MLIIKAIQLDYAHLSSVKVFKAHSDLQADP